MFILEGFAIGLGMIIFVGPVFFLLLNSSFQYGIKAGVLVALGIIVSDIVCVILCYYGLSTFITTPQNQFLIGAIGSCILIILAIVYFFKKPVIVREIAVTSTKLSTFFLKGFSVNFFNPFVFIVWISVYNYAQHSYTNEKSVSSFLIAVLLGILTTDLLKVFLSEKVKGLITEKRLYVFFKITAIVLLLFSFRLMYHIW